MTNRFHEYILLVAGKRGLTLSQIADNLTEDGVPTARQFSWEISNRPTMKIGKRVDLIQRLANMLGEPMSRLAFLAGLNPWANRLTVEEQGALWEFVERVVSAKEENTGKPPPSAYQRLCNSIFGGLETVKVLSPEELAEFLKDEE